MGLFKPNIEKLVEKRDVKGLFRALVYRSDMKLHQEAEKALERICDAGSVDVLLEVLNDKDRTVRKTAAKLLGEIGDPRAVEPLIQKFQLNDFERDDFARSLGQIGDPRAVEPLIAALERSSSAGVVKALGDIGEQRAIKPLASALGSRDYLTRVYASDALIRFGVLSVEPLVQQEASGPLINDDFRKSALEVFRKIGFVKVTAPLIAAYHKYPNSSFPAWALGESGDISAIKPLKDTLFDDVAHAAAEALDKLGWKPLNEDEKAYCFAAKEKWDQCVGLGAFAVEPLLKKLRRSEYGAYYLCPVIDTLGKIGDTRAAEPLIALLNAKEAEVCEAAVEALGMLGDKRAVEPLIAVLMNNRIDRIAVIEALGRLKDARATKPLIAVLEDPKDMCKAVTRALGQIGDPRTTELLIAKLDDENPWTRERAAQVLGLIGGAGAEEALIGLLRDKDERVRLGTATALDQLEWQSADLKEKAFYAMATCDFNNCVEIGMLASEALITALRYSRKGIRESAAKALDKLNWEPSSTEEKAYYYAVKHDFDKCVELGVPAVQPLLMTMKDGKKDIHAAAAEALGKIGDAGAAKLLAEQLNRGSWEMRKATANALISIAKRNPNLGILNSTLQNQISLPHNDVPGESSRNNCGWHHDQAHRDFGIGIDTECIL